MKIIFSENAFSALLVETKEKITTETGGLFLGFYNNGDWYIVETIDPGPNSIFEVAYFEYDQKYVTHLINKRARLYKKNLSLIGLWHRHPGSFDVFSGTDDGTNSTFAKLCKNGAISLLVNIDPKFRLTCYHVGFPLKYSKITYDVGNDLFPEHSMDLWNKDELLKSIDGYANSRSVRNLRVNVEKTITLKSVMEKVCNKMEKLDGNNYADEIKNTERDDDFIERLFDVVIDDIDYLAENQSVNFKIVNMKKYLCLESGSDNSKIYFTAIDSLKRFAVIYCGKIYLYNKGQIKSICEEKQSKDNVGVFDKLKNLFKKTDEGEN